MEKLVYGGDGLGRLDGRVVLAPFVLPGERIRAQAEKEKPGMVRARMLEVLSAAPDRVAAPCPVFGRCGGCHYQHASYDHQLEIKKEILRESLRRTTKLELPFDIEVHPSPPWNYRNRSRLQVQVRTEFAAGYFRFASHELLAVEQCPISSPLINRGIASLWQSGRAGKVPQGVREVEFFANADDTQLLLDVACAGEARRAAVRVWAEELRAALPEIAGVTRYSAPLGLMFRARNGLPAISPPWSEIVAYDLNEGTIKWRAPLGSVRALVEKGITNTGNAQRVHRNGPVVTAGGLIFIGTNADGTVRAFDKDTGKVLWERRLDANPEGMAAVFEVGGREYVVFCASSYESVPEGDIAIFKGSANAQGYYVFGLPTTPSSVQH